MLCGNCIFMLRLLPPLCHAAVNNQFPMPLGMHTACRLSKNKYCFKKWWCRTALRNADGTRGNCLRKKFPIGGAQNKFCSWPPCLQPMRKREAWAKTRLRHFTDKKAVITPTPICYLDLCRSPGFHLKMLTVSQLLHVGALFLKLVRSTYSYIQRE